MKKGQMHRLGFSALAASLVACLAYLLLQESGSPATATAGDVRMLHEPDANVSAARFQTVSVEPLPSSPEPSVGSADADRAPAVLSIEQLDPRIFASAGDPGQFAAYDDDDSSYTTQEYQEAIEAELIALQKSLGELQESYAAGQLDEAILKLKIRDTLVAFGARKSELSDKRIDQSHRFLLRDIVERHPELGMR